MSSEFKKEIILNTASDIVKYIDEKYAIDVDLYNIAELININIGFLFSAIEEFTDQT